MMAKKSKSHNKTASHGQIRIISGRHRGRKLPVVNAEGLRPTTDRVKETVFNWLMPHIYQARCLDLFAGSGGLGFEALSRGAESVQFVELNSQAAQQIKQNLLLLKANNGDVYQGSAEIFLSQTESKFDLVFIDPPFRQGWIEKIVPLLQPCLAASALVYLEQESEANLATLPTNWQCIKEKTAGQVSYRLFEVS